MSPPQGPDSQREHRRQITRGGGCGGEARGCRAKKTALRRLEDTARQSEDRKAQQAPRAVPGTSGSSTGAGRTGSRGAAARRTPPRPGAPPAGRPRPGPGCFVSRGVGSCWRSSTHKCWERSLTRRKRPPHDEDESLRASLPPSDREGEGDGPWAQAQVLQVNISQHQVLNWKNHQATCDAHTGSGPAERVAGSRSHGLALPSGARPRLGGHSAPPSPPVTALQSRHSGRLSHTPGDHQETPRWQLHEATARHEKRSLFVNCVQ